MSDLQFLVRGSAFEIKAGIRIAPPLSKDEGGVREMNERRRRKQTSC